MANISHFPSGTTKEPDKKKIFLVKVINVAINISILKAKFCVKSISGLDEKYRNH